MDDETGNDGTDCVPKSYEGILARRKQKARARAGTNDEQAGNERERGRADARGVGRSVSRKRDGIKVADADAQPSLALPTTARP